MATAVQQHGSPESSPASPAKATVRTDLVQVNRVLLNPRIPRVGEIAVVTKRRLPGARKVWMPIVTLHFPGQRHREYRPLVHFFHNNEAKSYDWKALVARPLAMLFDFVHAKASEYDELRRKKPWVRLGARIYKDFANALCNGTIIVQGGLLSDASNLWWTALGYRQARRLLRALSKFIIWMDGNGRDLLVNAGIIGDPLTGVGRVGSLLTPDYRRTASLLGHLKRPRNLGATVLPSKPTLQDTNPVYRLPQKYVSELLLDGFRNKDGETDICATLVAFMLIMGGVRSSEPFNLWVNDFAVVGGRPYVYLRHPAESIVHDPEWGDLTREEYLTRIGDWVPRNRSEDGLKSGWKGIAGDLDDARIHWLEVEGITPVLETFTALMSYYVLVVRPKIMAARRKKGLKDHPWLFVGSGKRWADSKSPVGDPYKLTAFRSAWGRGVRKIRIRHADPALEERKSNGTTPHGGRHFFGFEASAKTQDANAVMNLMHHLSPFSQFPYTRPSPDDYDAALAGDSKAGARISAHYNALDRYAKGRQWR